MLLAPVVILFPDLYPSNTLPLPVVTPLPAPYPTIVENETELPNPPVPAPEPKTVFWEPVTLNNMADVPITMLSSPVVLKYIEEPPIAMLLLPPERSEPPAPLPTRIDEFIDGTCSIRLPSILYPPVALGVSTPPVKVEAVVDVAVKYSDTVSPTTDSFAYGEVVPMPTLPVERIVSLAVSEGPIIVELAVLLVMLLPKAEAPEALAVLPYPKAEVFALLAVLPYPKAEEAVDPLAVLLYPNAKPVNPPAAVLLLPIA